MNVGRFSLPDVQSAGDTRDLAIDAVGVKRILYPAGEGRSGSRRKMSKTGPPSATRGNLVGSANLSKEEVHRQIVAGAGDAILFADREGRICIWNAGAEAIFGYSAGEALGRTLDLVIPRKLRARHRDGYERVMRTGVSRYGAGELLKVPGQHKSGRRLSIEFSIVIVLGADGDPAGAAAIIRDVTERWNREREAVVSRDEKSGA